MPAAAIASALAGVLAGIAALLGYRAWLRSRITPEERERRRREALAARGKMGDGTLVEFRENLLFYSYYVRGVEYIASQDVAQLLPPDSSIIGPIAVKYDARNPANSIVVAERWCGLRSKVE
jgi:hypothetical protein